MYYSSNYLTSYDLYNPQSMQKTQIAVVRSFSCLVPSFRGLVLSICTFSLTLIIVGTFPVRNGRVLGIQRFVYGVSLSKIAEP